MSGPYCETCEYFGPKPFGTAECMDPSKIIYYGKGDAVNDAPEVTASMTCRNWRFSEERAAREDVGSAPTQAMSDTPEETGTGCDGQTRLVVTHTGQRPPVEMNRRGRPGIGGDGQGWCSHCGSPRADHGKCPRCEV